MAKKSPLPDTQTQLDEIQHQLDRANSMLVLARRLTDEAAIDTSRMEWLEKNGVHILEMRAADEVGVYHNRSILVAGSLRETIDSAMNLAAINPSTDQIV